MLKLSKIKQIDKQSMFHIYDQWPEIAIESYKKNKSTKKFGKIDHIVFAGMGGSGAIGDVFSGILSNSNIHVDVIKGYLLPTTVNSKTLVINTSVSGNTKETLTILKNAHKKKCRMLNFSSGGKIEQYCKRNNLDFYKIQMNHSPRASFIGFLYYIISILKPIIPLKEQEIQKSLEQLRIIRDEIFSKNLSEQNNALNLAKWIPEIPVIYYPAGLKSSAIRFKNSLQENSKIHVISEDIVEASHNGIVSWSESKKFKPILIRGTDDYYKTKERWEIIKEFFKKNQIDYREIFSVKGNILSKLVCLIYFLDYCSIYKAIILNKDPTPVEPIDFVKRYL